MGKPMKPPSTGYFLFVKQGRTRGEPMTDIGIKWNELSDEERAFYDNKSTKVRLNKEIENGNLPIIYIFFLDVQCLQKEICLFFRNTDP
jgi:hypothetical protein